MSGRNPHLIAAVVLSLLAFGMALAALGLAVAR